jgi:hypothetical protein
VIRFEHHLYTPTTRYYTLQITDAQRLVSSIYSSPLAVSWQWIWTPELYNSHWTTHARYHTKYSLHSRTLAINSFRHSLPYRTELSTDNCLGRPSCLQDTSSSRITQKTQPLYFYRGGRGADHIQNTVLLLRACILQTLPSNICCLQSHCLAVGLYATVWFTFT